MKLRRLFAVLLVLALLLTGCGAEMAGNSAPADKAEFERASMPNESINSGESGSVAMPTNQKLIRKIWLEVETEEMDTLLGGVEAKIAELGGYVESRQMQNGSAYAARRYRYGSLTVRIPAEKLDAFVGDVSGVCNVVSNRETTEDVTLSYVESESRVIALETEQTRLLELLAQAETMDDILQIENRLTQIRGELEKVKSTLRVYDNQVNYGTVYLNITEVKEYTVVEPEPETLWQRMGKGLSDSWKSLVEGLGDFAVFLVSALPYLVLIGLIVTGIVLLRRRCKKKKETKEEPPKTE